METYETEAIVIGVKNYGDADKIATLFTPSRGKVMAMAYGARRPKNTLAAPLQMFHHIDATLSESYNFDIVRQASIKSRYKKFSEDLTVMAYGMFAAEVLSGLTTEGAADPAFFEYTLNIFSMFETKNPRITANIAAWQIIERAGFALSLNICPLCGKRNNPSEKNPEAFRVSLKEGGFLCDNCHTKDELTISPEAKNLLEDFVEFDDNSKLSVQGSKLVEVEQLLTSYLGHILDYPLKSLKFINELV